MHEMTRQLESNDTLIRNLEQAIRKHVKSIVALQREQETTRQVATERERMLEDKLKAGKETIARQVKDLQRYRVYVAELTDELDEPSSTIRVTEEDAPLTRKVSSCTGTNKNACFLSPSMNGTRKTVAPFAA
jgi:transcriptional regulator of heat shock response